MNITPELRVHCKLRGIEPIDYVKKGQPGKMGKIPAIWNTHVNPF